ncbi:hypothetical protein [Salibacterium lacus]|uniref:DUF4238 domain-containing protein n=1 Tax=Salibacterium lacus TaxID=1898109 RepID=A0ABW5T0R3_9BACI
MISNVPSFEEHRREKQKQADLDLMELLDAYEDWLKHNTNLREKVRAKHMFAEQAGCDVSDLEEEPWRQYFEDWFAFDYVTIIGSRLFDLFVKEKAAVLTPSQIQLSGLVLTAALEPFRVISLQSGSVTAVPLWEKEEKRLSSLHGNFPLFEKTSYILARPVYCGFENRVFSPVVPLIMPGDDAELREWKARYEKKEEENRRLRFMKDNGASWLVYADTSPL